MSKLKVGLVGAGVIGRKHAMALDNSHNCTLAGIVDVTDTAKKFASKLEIPYYTKLSDLLNDVSIQGIIIATPSEMHASQAILCAKNNIPTLIEKPITTTIKDAQTLIDISERTGTPVLTGHYRRFNMQVEEARRIVNSGQIGKLVGLSAIWAMKKHDEYYQIDWRTRTGGGPVLTNLIHDIDCLRWICGEIDYVGSQTSNAIRGFDVEDSAAITLKFSNNALGSVFLTDAAPSPWAFEATTSENPDFSHLGDSCYRFIGTEGSLDFPQLQMWKYPNKAEASWQFPMLKSQHLVGPGDPLRKQIEHFGDVILGKTHPRTDAKDGAKTLSATLAVRDAAAWGKTVKPKKI